MTNFFNVEVGQTIFIKSEYFGKPGELIETQVTKLGRMYITVAFKKMRFDKNSGVQIDGYGIPARLYLSKRIYQEERRLEGRKKYIKETINNVNLGTETLHEIYRALKNGGY